MHRRDFLKATAGAAVAQGAVTRPPNVVVIYCDDLGYGDLSCYGGSIRTPNIDRIASDGMRFTQFLSANPVCSPSRAALLTGRYPTRVSVPRVLFPYSKDGLPDSEMTIARMLKARDYHTCCVGKWHLGHLPQYLPTNRGFDEYFGIPYSNDMTPAVLMDNVEIIEQSAKQDTLTERYTQRAVRFIEKSKDKPFFLYIPHTFPHIPLYANKRFQGKSPHGIYGDVVTELDWSAGEVIGTLKKHGLERNTLVLFSSDNGPWFQGSPGRLRGRKGMTWEGGVRVPFIAKMPGRIPAGRVSHTLGSMLDVLPTVSKLCDVPLPSNPVDGIDLWPALSGKKPELDREALLYFDGWDLQCARLGRWKLHVARHNSVAYAPAPAGGRKSLRMKAPELYDVVADPDESYDVADQHTDVVSDLQGRVERLLPGFPKEVRDAWVASGAQGSQEGRAGAVAR